MKRSWTRALVTLTATIAVVLAVGATPAHAAPISLVNQHTHRCLADSFTNNLQVLPCRFPDSTQNWELGWSVAGYVQLKNAHTKRCIEDSFKYGLKTVACDAFPADPTQMWDEETDPYDGYYRFRNSHTERCIADSYAGGLEVLPCNRTVLTQLWR
ncbi:RICIN domain-containing protein [Asanoa iriomotensis]|uniref:Ricin B lectin domain-containing protein n=1 Tax=Asanoa iriomotensis TaxID=234613 RepID=A0ABQ4CAR6_9ACTN|nr:RICIN domain-containing protein [Asanoa iriomotensis]GIF59871.1 hypothetical protein Air01nite_59660 [Asanoa iriomotensis]